MPSDMEDVGVEILEFKTVFDRIFRLLIGAMIIWYSILD